jgi:hypothetical protein
MAITLLSSLREPVRVLDVNGKRAHVKYDAMPSGIILVSARSEVALDDAEQQEVIAWTTAEWKGAGGFDHAFSVGPL